MILQMIKETQVKEILGKNLPEMNLSSEHLKSLYKTIDCFSAYTKELIRQGNLPLVKNCFTTAEYLLEEGTANVKSAIENLYVFSVTSFLDITGAVSKQVKELLPAHIHAEYKKQVGHSCPWKIDLIDSELRGTTRCDADQTWNTWKNITFNKIEKW